MFPLTDLPSRRGCPLCHSAIRLNRQILPDLTRIPADEHRAGLFIKNSDCEHISGTLVLVGDSLKYAMPHTIKSDAAYSLSRT